MPNVLYVGHYRENSGWGQVARDNILALKRAGMFVVPRSIDLGQAYAEVPEEIIDMEKGDPSSCSVIIQHVLPHYMKYDNYFQKNIGIFELETKNIKHTPWVDHLNIMDELWVPCSDMSVIEGVHTKIHVLPHTCNSEQYSQEYSPLAIPALKDKFVFYFIGAYNRRKHISALLRAFHNEFHPSEPVALVIKTNRPGMPPEELAQEMLGLSNKIKENLRLYNSIDQYIKEVIITVDIAREELLRLHASCDCFVCPSYGEAWCIPAFEAMALGNFVISGNTGGPKDYIESDINGFLVKGSMEPVFGEHDTIPDFGTSRELEFNISISDLQKAMRRVYLLDEKKKDFVRTHARLTAKRYDYNTIGQKMGDMLNV